MGLAPNALRQVETQISVGTRNLKPIVIDLTFNGGTAGLNNIKSLTSSIPALRAEVRGLLGEYKQLNTEIQRTGGGRGNSNRPAALRVEAEAARMLKQAMYSLRNEWQAERVVEADVLIGMKQFNAAAAAQMTALKPLIDGLRAKGTLTVTEGRELQRLTSLYKNYSDVLRTSASTMNTINGVITKGSLAAGVAAGVKGATSAIKLLDSQLKAGLITQTEYNTGLTAQKTAMLGTLEATQAEIAVLKAKGVLEASEVGRLNALTTAERQLTGSIASATQAQERQAAAQRAAAGAGLGIRDAGGMSNLGMAASFINPELGMAAMALSMGPVVAGAAAVGLFVKTLGDGIDKAAIFQRSLKQIGAISGESAQQMNQYGQYIQNLSTQLPISTQKLAEMGREAVMVGLHGPEGMRVYTQNMGAFSIITRTANGELGHTAEVGQEVVKILRSTGATTEEVTTGFGRMINGLVGLKTQSGVAIPQVTALLKFWSSQGHAVGLTIEQMTGLSAALIQTGARAQGAGGAMAKFFDTAESAAAAGGPKIEAWAKVLGLTADKARDLLQQDPMEFLRRFVTGAEQLDNSGTALSLTLGSVGLNSAQVRRTMAELSNALPLVTGNIKIMTDASNDQGLALRKAIDASDNYKDKLTLLGQGFDNLKTNMAMAVLPGMEAVLSWALSLSGALASGASNLAAIGKAQSAGSAAPGAMTYDLPTWLKNSGLGINQLTADQQKRATDLLRRMQQAANDEQQQMLVTNNLPIPQVLKDQMTQQIASMFARRIGEMGTQLVQVQEAASRRGPVMGPLTQGQMAAGGASVAGYAAPGNEIGHQLAAYAVQGLHGATTDVAGECSVWVREVFQMAFPKAGRALFGGTANITRQNFQDAGLLHKYDGDASKLKEGQVVFNKNDLSGNGHVGIVVIKNGETFVAENSSVVAKHSPTGDARALTPIAHFGAITDVGDVNTYSKIPGAIPGNPEADDAQAPKAFRAYIKEAKRLQAAIDKALKDGNADAWRNATQAMSDFTSNNKEAADAVTWLNSQVKTTAATAAAPLKALKADFAGYQAEYAKGTMGVDAYHAAVQKIMDQASQLSDTQKRGSKAWVDTQRLIKETGNVLKGHAEQVSQYGQAYDTMRRKLDATDSNSKLGVSDASTLASLDKIRKTAEAAATAEKARNGESAKYVALLNLAGDAAGKADSIRKAQSQAAKQVAADAKRAEAEQRQQAAAAASFQKNINRQTSDSEITTQQARLKALEAARDRALAVGKGDAASQLTIETDKGKAILAIQKDIITKQREAALQAARDTADRARADAAVTYKGAKNIPISVLRSINKAERNQGAAARDIFDSDISVAEDQANKRITDLTVKIRDTADKNLKAAEQYLADGMGEQAKEAAGAVLTQYDAALKGAGDNQAAIFAVQQSWAGRRLQALNAQTQAESDIQAQKLKHDANVAAYADGVTTAKRLAIYQQLQERLNSLDTTTSAKQKQNALDVAQTVQKASDTASKALTDVKRGYKDAVETFSQKLMSGEDISSTDVQDYLRSLSDLWASAGKAGVKGNAEVQQLRDLARQLADPKLIQGMQASAAAYNSFWDTYGKRNDPQAVTDSALRKTYGNGQNGLEGAMLGSGANVKLLGDPQAALSDLDQFNKDAADRIRRVYADELKEFQTYHDALNASVLETTTAAYAQIKQAAQDQQDVADDTSITVDSLTAMLQRVLANGLDPSTSGYVQLLEEIIAKGGQAGEAAQQVKDNLDSIINTTLAPSLNDVLDNPDAYSDGAPNKDAGTPDPSVTSALQGQLDNQKAAGIRDLTDAELKARAAADQLTGDGKDLAAVLAEIDSRAQAVKTALENLPATKLQIQLNELERLHTAGNIGEGAYINQREAGQRDLENAQYAVSSAHLTGAALEAAKLQHEDRLTQIQADGEAARKTITDQAAVDAQAQAAKMAVGVDLGGIVQQAQGLYDGLASGALGADKFAAGLALLVPRLQALADIDPSGAAASALKQVQADLAVAQALAASGIQTAQRALEVQHTDGLISERGYIDERERLALESAQTEFDVRTRTLQKGMPEYRQAEVALQDAQTAAAEEGRAARKKLIEQEAADAVTTAQNNLSRLQKYSPGADPTAARSAVVGALQGQIDNGRSALTMLIPGTELYWQKLEEIMNLEDQIHDIKLNATLVIHGFDTGIAAFQLLQTAGSTLGSSLSDHFAKVAQGSETMAQATASSLAEMTVAVVKQLQQQVIATEAAALATDLLSGNYVKAAIDVGIIAAVGIGGGLLSGALTPSGAATTSSSASGSSGTGSTSPASTAPSITYHLELNSNFTISEGINSPGTRQQLESMQESTALRIMDRAGLIKLPAALPATS